MPSDERLSRLLETLAQVAISVELQPTLQILLDSLHTLVPFDAGGIFVRQAGRQVVRASAAREYPADLEMPSSEGIVGEVIRSGRSRLVGDVRRDPTYVAVRSSTAAQLCVPLASPRGVLGAIALESDRPSAFDDQDLALVTLFAQQASVVIERSMLHEQLIRESRVSRDMEIAGQILQGLTPTAAPTFPGLQVFGRSRTAESVGGDAFDFIPYPENQVGLSIADAKGKGLPAALLAVAHRAIAARVGQRRTAPARDIRSNQRHPGAIAAFRKLHHRVLRDCRCHRTPDGVRERWPSAAAHRSGKWSHRIAGRHGTCARVSPRGPDARRIRRLQSRRRARPVHGRRDRRRALA